MRSLLCMSNTLQMRTNVFYLLAFMVDCALTCLVRVTVQLAGKDPFVTVVCIMIKRDPFKNIYKSNLKMMFYKTYHS